LFSQYLENKTKCGAIKYRPFGIPLFPGFSKSQEKFGFCYQPGLNHCSKESKCRIETVKEVPSKPGNENAVLTRKLKGLIIKDGNN